MSSYYCCEDQLSAIRNLSPNRYWSLAYFESALWTRSHPKLRSCLCQPFWNIVWIFSRISHAQTTKSLKWLSRSLHTLIELSYVESSCSPDLLACVFSSFKLVTAKLMLRPWSFLCFLLEPHHLWGHTSCLWSCSTSSHQPYLWSHCQASSIYRLLSWVDACLSALPSQDLRVSL